MRAKLLTNSITSFIGIVLLLQLSLLNINGAPVPGPRHARIKGRVFDINKASIFNALVIVEGFQTRLTLLTNERGEFEVLLLPGEYRITAEANGFRRFVSARFNLKSAQTQSIKLQLDIAPPVLPVPADGQLQTQLKFH